MEQIRAAAFGPRSKEAKEEEEDSTSTGTPFQIVKPPAKASLNDPCPCGSGKKYKRCCGKEK